MVLEGLHPSRRIFLGRGTTGSAPLKISVRDSARSAGCGGGSGYCLALALAWLVLLPPGLLCSCFKLCPSQAFFLTFLIHTTSRYFTCAPEPRLSHPHDCLSVSIDEA